VAGAAVSYLVMFVVGICRNVQVRGNLNFLAGLRSYKDRVT
jgi:hypothetical protein